MSTLPEIIWKYREWSNPDHRAIIQNGAIFFASAERFNDPFEYVTNFNLEGQSGVELSVDDTYVFAKTLIPDTQPTWEEFLHRPKRIIDTNTYQEAHKNSMDKDFGVFSGSGRNDSILMWSHYGDKHRGFCVGLDTNSLLDHLKQADSNAFQCRLVTYSESIPVTYPNRGGMVPVIVETSLFSKSIEWQYEQEIRIVRLGGPIKIHIPADCIRYLCVGWKMPERDQVAVRDVMSTFAPHARVLKMRPISTQYKLSTYESPIPEHES